MPTTVFLSIRGEGASRVLEMLLRTLGEEGESLVVVPTNDDNGYHGSADVSDVAAAREAFALARKPFPSLKGYLGVGGREDLPPRPAPHPSEGRPARGGESRGRGPERAHEGRDGRGQGAESRPRGQERGEPERGGDKTPPAEGAERAQRRAPLRGRNRNQRRQGTGEGQQPQ